ncbi:MAG: hypothetical protein KIS86_13130 [Devosia sp.]|nr:hypothetical protein [Devosia sp.]
MTWIFSPFAALSVALAAYGLNRALRGPGLQPEMSAIPLAPARTLGERAWRDEPVQTFVWQLQAARYSEPPFSRS